MAWKYSLNNLFPKGESFRLTYTNKDGIVQNSLLSFEYGKVYTTEDEVLVQSLKKLVGRYPRTASNKQLFEDNHIKFEEKQCPSCGGRVLKYEVHYFDIEEVA